MRLGPCEQRNRRLGRRYDKHCGHIALRTGHQFQGGRRDDPQTALSTNQKMAQIIAGVILAQAFETVKNLAVGQYGLNPQT